MNNNKTNPAIIHATLAIGSGGGAPYYDVNIQQQLCMCACADEQPVFKPQFSIIGVEDVGTGQHLVYIHVEGVVSYVPCGCGTCCTKSQIISQDFTIPVFNAAAIKVTIAAGDSRNYIVKNACNQCSKTFESDTPITLTITTA